MHAEGVAGSDHTGDGVYGMGAGTVPLVWGELWTGNGLETIIGVVYVGSLVPTSPSMLGSLLARRNTLISAHHH